MSEGSDNREETEAGPPPTVAIALRYDPLSDPAPIVVASGRDYVASQILNIARKHKIPMREDKALASMLAGLDLGGYIPPEMYRAVAEVLAWVYRVENGTR